MRRVYLDYNATTPVATAVQNAILPFLAAHYGNPSSGHSLGQAAHEAVDDARARVAALVGAQPSEIVFTGGGSESNNLALKGATLRRGGNFGGHLVISAIEHPAIAEPARYLESLGFRLTVLACDSGGIVDPATLEDALRDDTLLVSIMYANNEIGSIQPIAQLADVCRRRSVLFHTDAAQAIGKIPTKVNALGVDLLSIAGHKFYAPKGVGALYVRRGVELEPLVHGAAHEGGRRAGTENVPYIVGLGQAADLANDGIEGTQRHLAHLRDRLQELLCADIGDGLTINAVNAPRLPNTLSVNFPGVDAGRLLARVPELCASTGAACHSGMTHMSATLAAIGLRPEQARGTIRLSVGRDTDEAEIEYAADVLIAAWNALK